MQGRHLVAIHRVHVGACFDERSHNLDRAEELVEAVVEAHSKVKSSHLGVTKLDMAELCSSMLSQA